MNFLKIKEFSRLSLFQMFCLKHCEARVGECFISKASFSCVKLQNCRSGFYSGLMCYQFSQVQNYAKKSQEKLFKGGKQKTIHLTDEEISDVIDIIQYKNELQMVIEKLKKDFAEHLSLRSSASNIDNIIVKIEDQEYSLHELAQISRKNPNLIAINMADFPEGLKPAIQAITESGAGMNPQQEGTMIYITVPKLTRDHRELLAKNSKSMFIKAKEEVRTVQNFYVKEAKKKTDLSEDLVFSATNQIMALAEHCVQDMEKITKSKQKELLGD